MSSRPPRLDIPTAQHGDESEVTPPPIEFPFPAPPKPLELVKVAEGVFWLRLQLPFRLDHVNVYLIEDGDGFTLVDTGIDNAATRELWQALLAGPLSERPLTRIIATHYHPDHMGLAGWLSERFGLPLLASQTEYLLSLTIRLDPGALNAEPYRGFYLSHGLSESNTQLLLNSGLYYLRMVSELPRTFQRVIAGETLRIGGRDFAVMTGGGHSPEQVMLHCAAENLVLCADQAMAKITPNISVEAMDPDGDPLGVYLRSLESLKQTLPDDVLVLPGHNLPFVGLPTRIDELAAHHESRCGAIRAACADGPRSVAELVPVLFKRVIDDPHQMGFAFSEALAHANYLVRRNALAVRKTAAGALLETLGAPL
jgi:glyoxylase-like metal-dependent hydrolase (beta-lactamase superfamily II)